MPSAEPTTLLREASLRVTRPRVGVIKALEQHPHADVDRIATLTRADVGAVSVQAIYDVLHALTDAGVVRKIEPAGSPAKFELRVGDNHHHVVCRSCGAIADVDCQVGEPPCMDAPDSHGFVIDEAEVIYWGVCPSCTSTSNP